jgi:fructose-bisphosphate aldolase class II
LKALKAINPDILVEGEIGDIGTGSEIHEAAPDLSRGLTTPEEARQYVDSTGVDTLAPAVGNRDDGHSQNGNHSKINPESMENF